MTRSVIGMGPRRLLVSRIAVVVLALVSSYYNLATISLNWSPHGFIGIYIDQSTALVSGLEPWLAKQDIEPGDRVELAAMPFRERGYLYETVAQPAGTRMTVPLIRGEHKSTVRIKVAPFGQRPDIYTFVWTRRVVAMIFIVMGVILVWNRPSVMLWGLAVSLISLPEFSVKSLASPAIAALLIFGNAFFFAIRLPGLIVFAARFPNGRATNATKFWDIAAAGVFIFGMLVSLHDYVPLFIARPIPDWPEFDYLFSAMYVAVFIVLCIKLRKNRSTRNGFGWIVAGYGVGIVIGKMALNYLFIVPSVSSDWRYFGQLVMMLAFPASVAYSLIRHRSFGLGYLTNRTIVFASLTIGVVSTFLIGVWLTSARLSSTLGIGIAMFVALLAGMAFQIQHRRAIRFVDRIFLPHRYESGVSLDRIRETLRGTNDAKRVTGEVAATLGLASVAVFERTSDGGFVRNAACGWPHGTAWHLLPGEALTLSLGNGATVIPLPDASAEESGDDFGFPGAHARPRVALTIRRGDRVQSAVLVGDYNNGASLDRDAIRSVHGVFTDALLV